MYERKGWLYVLSKNVKRYIADSLEEFLNLLDFLIIVDNVSKEDYDRSVKAANKVIKKLKKGKGDNLFDPEMASRYSDMLEQEAKQYGKW